MDTYFVILEFHLQAGFEDALKMQNRGKLNKVLMPSAYYTWGLYVKAHTNTQTHKRENEIDNQVTLNYIY